MALGGSLVGLSPLPVGSDANSTWPQNFMEPAGFLLVSADSENCLLVQKRRTFGVRIEISHRLLETGVTSKLLTCHTQNSLLFIIVLNFFHNILIFQQYLDVFSD